MFIFKNVVTEQRPDEIPAEDPFGVFKLANFASRHQISSLLPTVQFQWEDENTFRVSLRDVVEMRHRLSDLRREAKCDEDTEDTEDTIDRRRVAELSNWHAEMVLARHRTQIQPAFGNERSTTARPLMILRDFVSADDYARISDNTSKRPDHCHFYPVAVFDADPLRRGVALDALLPSAPLWCADSTIMIPAEDLPKTVEATFRTIGGHWDGSPSAYHEAYCAVSVAHAINRVESRLANARSADAHPVFANAFSKHARQTVNPAPGSAKTFVL